MFWLLLLLVSATALALLRGSAGYDRYVDRPATTAPVCGASNGELVCRLPPHTTALHQDLSRSNQWHSATFRTTPKGLSAGKQ